MCQRDRLVDCDILSLKMCIYDAEQLLCFHQRLVFLGSIRQLTPSILNFFHNFVFFSNLRRLEVLSKGANFLSTVARKKATQW